MIALLTVAAGLTCLYLIYTHLGSRKSKKRLPVAFGAAETTRQPYDEAWDKHTVVWDIQAAHGPTPTGHQHDVVRLAPSHYSISDPQLVRSVFASAPKTSFYTDNFSHAPLPTIAFEMVHTGDAQRRKTQTGGFLRLQGWEWSRFEVTAGDVCRRMSSGLERMRERSKVVDVYDHVGAACMELGMRAMMGELAPPLVPLNEQGKAFMAEISASYPKIGCSQTVESAPSTIDAWCHQAFQKVCKSGNEVPRILESLRKYSDELGSDEISGIAAAEVSDDAIASHLCGIVTATLMQRLAERRDWQNQVRVELSNRVAGQRPESCLCRPVLSSCKALGAVFWETLRLSPPVAGPQPRVLVSESSQLRDWGIESGSIVTASAYLVNRSSMFGPDPDTWNPQRWLETSEETTRRWQRLMFTFGSGSRACEGREIAKFICLAVTAWIVLDFDLSSDTSCMEPAGGFIAHPKANGDGEILPLRLKKRL